MRQGNSRFGFTGASSNNELRSRTFEETARASSAKSGSSLSRSPYSAIATEHPDAADTIASAPAFFNARTLARAKSRARAALPECKSSAPQHEVDSSLTMRYPAAASKRSL